MQTLLCFLGEVTSLLSDAGTTTRQDWTPLGNDAAADVGAAAASGFLVQKLRNHAVALPNCDHMAHWTSARVPLGQTTDSARFRRPSTTSKSRTLHQVHASV